MEIKETAVAGTLESSDIQIMLSKGTDGIAIDLESDVAKQFGNQIKKVITETLTAMGIQNAKVKAVDKARTIAAAQRAAKTTDEPAWEVL